MRQSTKTKRLTPSDNWTHPVSAEGGMVLWSCYVQAMELTVIVKSYPAKHSLEEQIMVHQLAYAQNNHNLGGPAAIHQDGVKMHLG